MLLLPWSRSAHSQHPPLPCTPYLPRSYLDDMTPERVDAQGVANVAAAAAKYLPRAQRSVEGVLSMRSASDIAKWQRCVGWEPVRIGTGRRGAVHAGAAGLGKRVFLLAHSTSARGPPSMPARLPKSSPAPLLLPLPAACLLQAG